MIATIPHPQTFPRKTNSHKFPWKKPGNFTPENYPDIPPQKSNSPKISSKKPRTSLK